MKESDCELRIMKVSNGFVLKDSEGKITVVEDRENDEISAGEKLLWEIINLFGLAGDQFGRECLSVIRTAGDEYALREDEQLVDQSYQQVKQNKSKKHAI